MSDTKAARTTGGKKRAGTTTAPKAAKTAAAASGDKRPGFMKQLGAVAAFLAALSGRLRPQALQ